MAKTLTVKAMARPQIGQIGPIVDWRGLLSSRGGFLRPPKTAASEKREMGWTFWHFWPKRVDFRGLSPALRTGNPVPTPILLGSNRSLRQKRGKNGTFRAKRALTPPAGFKSRPRLMFSLRENRPRFCGGIGGWGLGTGFFGKSRVPNGPPGKTPALS